MEYGQNINFTPARQRTFEDVGFIDVDLSTARTKPEALGIAGRTIFIGTLPYDGKYEISSSKSVGQAILTLNEPNGNPIEASKGMFYDFSTKENQEGVFNDVYIRNEAQSGKMLRIFFTTQTQIKPFSSEIEISGQIGTTLTPDADASVTTTVGAAKVAANASRKELIVKNTGASTIRIGDATITATKGDQLLAGEGRVITTTAALYARTETGTSTLSILENE